MTRELVSLLPGDEVVLYDERRNRDAPLGLTEVVAQRLTTPERIPLLKNAADARYVRTGHLLFMRDNNLFAVGFDLLRLRPIGDPKPVLGKVQQVVLGNDAVEKTLAGQFALSSTGHLAYLPSWVSPTKRQMEPVSVDRAGRPIQLGLDVGEYVGQLRWLPGDQRLSYLEPTNPGEPLRLVMMERLRRKPFPRGGWYAWSPDFKQVAVLHGNKDLVLCQADDLPCEPIPSGEGFAPSSWSRDGRYLVGSKTADGDLYLLSLGEPGRPVRRLVETRGDARATNPELSRDGRWLAYQLNDPTPTVIVRSFSFPNLGPPKVASVG